jgi:hypothetical protein
LYFLSGGVSIKAPPPEGITVRPVEKTVIR